MKNNDNSSTGRAPSHDREWAGDEDKLSDTVHVTPYSMFNKLEFNLFRWIFQHRAHAATDKIDISTSRNNKGGFKQSLKRVNKYIGNACYGIVGFELKSSGEHVQQYYEEARSAAARDARLLAQTHIGNHRVTPNGGGRKRLHTPPPRDK